MTPATLDADLRASGARHAERVAVVSGDDRLTYAELDRRAASVAAGLRALGVRRGDRVVVMLPNSLQSAEIIYGVLRAGAAFVVLNPTTKADKLRRLLAHSGAVLAVCEHPLAERVLLAGEGADSFRHVVVTGAEEDLPEHVVSYDELAATEPDGEPPAPPLSVDLAAIIYTSGSTGDPKGVAFAHRSMHFVSGSIIDYLALSEADRILCVLPLAHTYGLYQLLMSVRVGATLVLEPGATMPGRLVEVLEQERITVLPGVPTIWQVLLSMTSLDERETPHLRVLTNAGAALSTARLEAVRRAFPGASFFSMYGQTECKRALYLPPEELDRRPGSVGIAIPGTEVWVEDELGRVVAPGEVGELMIRGDHVMQGYWDDPAATARRVREGDHPGDRVLRSGDLFRSDEDGYLWFVARKDDIIKSRGEKVAPREVEDVLYAAPAVREAAVVGVEDALLGQLVVAHVSLTEGHEREARGLRRWCAERLEDYAVPRHIVFHDALPKTDNGKIDRMHLISLGDGRAAR